MVFHSRPGVHLIFLFSLQHENCFVYLKIQLQRLLTMIFTNGGVLSEGGCGVWCRYLLRFTVLQALNYMFTHVNTHALWILFSLVAFDCVCVSHFKTVRFFVDVNVFLFGAYLLSKLTNSILVWFSFSITNRLLPNENINKFFVTVQKWQLAAHAFAFVLWQIKNSADFLVNFFFFKIKIKLLLTDNATWNFFHSVHIVKMIWMFWLVFCCCCCCWWCWLRFTRCNFYYSIFSVRNFRSTDSNAHSIRWFAMFLCVCVSIFLLASQNSTIFSVVVFFSFCQTFQMVSDCSM